MLTVLTFISGGAAFGEQASGSDPDADKPLRLLFIGNSYTYVNELPELAAAMIRTQGRIVQTGGFLAGGCTLRKHWEDNLGKPAEGTDPARKRKLDELLADGAWDCAIIQGQSLEPVKRFDEFSEYATLLVEHIRAVQPRIRIIFYATWARQNRPEDQDKLTKAYQAVARANRAEMAPVGTAWVHAFAKREEIALHSADMSHPSPLGSYLAACVFYAIITGKTPVGLPATLEYEKVGGKSLINIPADDALFVQQATLQATKTRLRRR